MEGVQVNVLSLFDGMSCGQIALNKCGIKYNNYFASEIDKHAIKVTQFNFPKTIQLGDVTKITALNLPKIDLVIGGSPCQGFSLAGKQLNFKDERSVLFFEYVRILNEIRQINPSVKFVLENVKMKKEWVEIIDEILGVKGRFINSSLVSAQNRQRWYWTNLNFENEIQDENITLNDILQDNVDSKYFIKTGKLGWLKNFGQLKDKNGYISFIPNKTGYSEDTAYILQWPHGSNKGGIRATNGKSPALTTSSWVHNNLLLSKGYVRKLTPVECERLQTVPDNYSSCVSDSQRYKMLGNGWTVNVICYVLKGLIDDTLRKNHT